MNRVLGYVLACLLFAMGPAVSQEIRAGDHADFSRLVLPFGPSDTYEITKGERSETYAFSRPLSLVGTQAALSMLPSGRIVKLSTGPGRLTLDFGCACYSEAFLFNDSYLVIDIFEAAQTTEERISLVEPFPIDSFLDDGFPLSTNAPSPEQPTFADRNSAYLDDASRQIFQAIQTNVLSARPGNAGAEPGAQDVGFDPTAQMRSNLESRRTAQECELLQSFDVRRWPDREAALAQIGSARRALVSDSGDVLQTHVQDLTTAYLALGFGAEVLSLTDYLGASAELAQVAAEVVDGITIQESPLESKYLMCGSVADFWLVVSGSELTDHIDPLDIERYFFRLGDLQKDQFRKAISNWLFAEGHVDVANRLTQFEQRLLPASSGGSSAPETFPYDARIDLSTTDRIIAEFEQQLQAGSALDEEAIVLARSVLRTEQSEEKQFALLSQLARSAFLDRDQQAFFAITGVLKEDFRAETPVLFETILGLLSFVADDGEFLEMSAMTVASFEGFTSSNPKIGEMAQRAILLMAPSLGNDLLGISTEPSGFGDVAALADVVSRYSAMDGQHREDRPVHQDVVPFALLDGDYGSALSSIDAAHDLFTDLTWLETGSVADDALATPRKKVLAVNDQDESVPLLNDLGAVADAVETSRDLRSAVQAILGQN